MKRILQENKKFIIAVLMIWAVCIPVVLYHRDTIFARYILFFSNPDYNPKTARNLLKTAYSILENIDFKMNSMPEKDESSKKWVEGLRMMEESCKFVKSLNHSDEILFQPTWSEKESLWTTNKMKSIGGLGASRTPLPDHFDPREFWKAHANDVMEAMDYAKRALNFSGPDIEVPELIELTSRSVCRDMEIFQAYYTFMLDTEKFVSKKLSKEDKLPVRLSAKELRTILWSFIRQNKIPEISANKFLSALLKLSSAPVFYKSSLFELDEILDALIFLSADELQRNGFRRQKGLLYMKIAEDRKEYLKKALVEFHAAVGYQDLKKIENHLIRKVLADIFEVKLLQVECLYKLQEYGKARSLLRSLENDLHRIDGRDNANPNLGLLREYKKHKKNVLLRLGHYSEADEIQD